jgi:uncharacterized protein YbjT (DUF2867 family)
MPGIAEKAVRHWLVTGGSGGLGRRLVEHVLRQGDRVTATVRRAGAPSRFSTSAGSTTSRR